MEKVIFGSILLFVIFIMAKRTSGLSAAVNKWDGESHEAGKYGLESNPKYSHFFNGSYAVQDVLRELLNNKSLTSHPSKWWVLAIAAVIHS